MTTATKEKKVNDKGGADRLFPRAVEVTAAGKKAYLVPFTVEDLDDLGEILKTLSTEIRGADEIRTDDLLRILISGKMVRRTLRFLLLRNRVDADGKPRPVNPDLHADDLGRIELLEAAEIIERAVVDLDLAAIVGKAIAGMERFRKFTESPADRSPLASNGPSSRTS